MSSKSRNWVFTLANPTGMLEWCDNVKYAVYQQEVSADTGLDHFQGMVQLKTARALTYLQDLVPGAHWEQMMGPPERARAYCMKQDTRVDGPWEHGEFSISNPGKRNDLLVVKKRLDEGSSVEELAKDETTFPTWCKYTRAIQEYKRIRLPNRDFKTIVWFLYGPPGTGKSRWAMENYPDAYWKQRSNWWCGYEATECVVLDDYYGWLPWDTLLRLMDRYPMLVETKGGQTKFVATTLIITSNKLPHEWYRGKFDMNALYRRVDHFMVYSKSFPPSGVDSQYSTEGVTAVEEMDLSSYASDMYARRLLLQACQIIDGQNNSNDKDNNNNNNN
jgi:hypothetical protein